MNLLVDAGNTRIKFGWCCAANPTSTIPNLAVLPDQLNELPALLTQAGAPLSYWKSQPAKIHAIGVNVAGGAIQRRLEQAIAALGFTHIEWLSSQESRYGLRNRYAVASQLGTDRWVALLGLHAHTLSDNTLSSQPLILASFGTATTVDTLSPQNQQKEREFPGGLILPGPSLMLQSLHQSTAQLPLAGGPSLAYPQDTLSAISSGVAASQVGAVLRQWHQGLLHYGRAPSVYLSGGGLDLIYPELQQALQQAYQQLGLRSTSATLLPVPVLQGMAYILSLHKLSLAPRT
ncbi:type III pantothenate kinase [Alcaligenes endophyticus]|uniref:Type III pantothenate kinase n=1 Tax=Alcaligenes endophyticus TaxID=1929088 RepID=A0ABT8EEE7_9BURK|nr:type III pantothenate kinase [Alcaligenes endophyticus]MCX5592228.1 type III pantothenate kinase [Alcaligenes endophyticus]MDN4119670.1 type III pantothenate kinase [Alcaligenes endophyticus]